MKLALLFIICTALGTAHATEVEGGLGFGSLPCLFSKEAWNKFTHDHKLDRVGDVDIKLDDPTQVVFIYNMWALPTPKGDILDIRFQNLKNHFLHAKLSFSDKWPEYDVNGLDYIAVVRKKDGRWVLVAKMGKFYFLQDDYGYGIVPMTRRNDRTM